MSNSVIGMSVNIDKEAPRAFVKIMDSILVKGETKYLVAGRKLKDVKVIDPSSIIKFQRSKSKAEEAEDDEE